MEWNGVKGAVEKKLTNAPPRIEVKARLMEELHGKYGVKCSSSGIFAMSAVTDTGCQTSTAGVDILKKLSIPERYLIPTCHRIIGITDTHLHIMGALLLEMEYNDRVTRQMVYISSNSGGLYLSETACKELGLIDRNFPKCDPSTSATLKVKELQDDEE